MNCSLFLRSLFSRGWVSSLSPFTRVNSRMLVINYPSLIMIISFRQKNAFAVCFGISFDVSPSSCRFLTMLCHCVFFRLHSKVFKINMMMAFFFALFSFFPRIDDDDTQQKTEKNVDLKQTDDNLWLLLLLLLVVVVCIEIYIFSFSNIFFINTFYVFCVNVTEFSSTF